MSEQERHQTFLSHQRIIYPPPWIRKMDSQLLSDENRLWQIVSEATSKTTGPHRSRMVNQVYPKLISPKRKHLGQKSRERPQKKDENKTK